MSHLILKLTLAILVGLTAAIGLVRAQPHDDDAIRRFFGPPDGCAAPCWMGIRPGVTTGTEAEQILKAHPWVSRVEPWGQASVMVWWSGAQPAFVNAEHPGILRVENNIVQRISLPTTVSFGDVWLLYELPTRGGFICLGRAWRSAVVHFATFPDAGFAVSLQAGLPARCQPNVDGQRCPMALDAFWGATSDLILGPVYVQLDDYAEIRSATPPFCFE